MLGKTKALLGLGAVLVLALGGGLWWSSSHGDDGQATSLASAAPTIPPNGALPPSPDGIPLALPHAAAVREPSAPGAWGGQIGRAHV